MKPTIYDVAKKANVSISTVSKVLNDTGSISEKTKKKIWDVIDELQYQPSLVLSAKKALKTIGVLIPDISNPFMAEITRAIEDSGRKHGFSVIICSTDNDSTKEEEYISMLKQKYVDGIIVATGLRGSQAIRELIESDMPVAMLSRDVPYLPVHTVVVDDFQGGYDAAVHLTNLGHKKVAMIAEDINIPSIKKRVDGFKEGIQISGIAIDDLPILYSSLNLNECRKVCLELLKDTENRPTAIFVSTEMLAFGVLQAARLLNLQVPTQLSLIGFDNSMLAKLSDPALTTIAQPIEEMGAKVIDLLVDEITNQNQDGRKKVTQRIMLSPYLITRDSTSPYVKP
ncbi:LacI family DNA-binding transcriptional regulator [Niallia taxi]|uniref:LacI family DNA-binding transcriptional regulator n=1 Tax=Niallia taxi TaxID=2499688 RepID=UPI00254A8DE0|nr:LacI family DNA-binding transcriptional regulator [Niallia taxi]MDK8640460.1 LacI family DNA-binding transcriptional regulator [Niallia taxi]